MRIALVVFVAAAVVGAGYFGPRPAPRSSPSPAPSLIAQKGTPAPSPTPKSTVDPLIGLTLVNPQPSQLKVTWLPGQTSSRSVAVVGTSLFYIVDGDRIESIQIGSAGAGQTIVTVPHCQGINQLAAVGHELAYVVTSPGGTTSQIGGCESLTAVSWSIWLLDLNGGSPHQVANGVREASSIDIAEFPTHIALTTSAFAFDRASTSANDPSETVEVHALDGHVLWTSQCPRPVVDVMLGGGNLAVLMDVIGHSDKVLDLMRSDATYPELHRVDGPASSASLSPDGSYLAWDLPPLILRPETTPQPLVGIETLDPGTVEFFATLTGTEVAAPRHPTVAVTGRGLVLAWLATGPDGAVYPAFRYTNGGTGAILSSFQQPVWLTVQGETMIWLAESANGWSKAVFSIDLSTLGLS